MKKYGLQMLVTTDDGLAEYLETAMGQLKVWLERGDVTRLVVVSGGKRKRGDERKVAVRRRSTQPRPSFPLLFRSELSRSGGGG